MASAWKPMDPADIEAVKAAGRRRATGAAARLKPLTGVERGERDGEGGGVSQQEGNG